MQTASPGQGRGELQVALDDGRRYRTEHAITARALLKCSWVSHLPTRKERVEPTWIYDFCMGGNKRQQYNLIQPASKEMIRLFNRTEILNIDYVWKRKVSFSRTEKCEVSPPVKFLMGISWDISSWSAAAGFQRGTTSPHPRFPKQRAHSSECRLDPEHSSLYIHPLREHSKPHTALHKPKSANPWRSLVFWFYSGDTRASQGTDIIPERGTHQAEVGQRDAQGLLFIRVSLSMFRFVRVGLLPHLQFLQDSHLSKTRILSHIHDGQSYFRKVSGSRIRCLQTLSVLLSAPKLAISDV